MRKQTEEEKTAQAIAREKKKNQRKERLRAARRRKRERLGLPPGDGTTEEGKQNYNYCCRILIAITFFCLFIRRK